MKIYKTQKEVDADTRDGVLEVNGDVIFEFPLITSASLKIVGNISARNLSAHNITAWNLRACEILAHDITAQGITAWNLTARGNITANNISAMNIMATGDISFYAVAFAYRYFVCKSISGRRKNSKYFCLDGNVEIKG